MIDYLFDVKSFEDQGLSDDIILKHLSSRTMRTMPCGDARMILQENGAVIIDPINGSKNGLLISYYESLPLGSESQVLIAYFIEHVFGDGVEVDTTVYPRSVQWADVTAAMPAPLQPVVSLLLESAGGRPDADVVENDIIEARENHEAQEAERAAQEAERAAQAEYINEQNATKKNYDQLYNQHIAPLYSAKDMSDASWTAALQAMSENWTSN